MHSVVRDVRARLTPGQSAGQSTPCDERQDNRQPDPVPTVRAMSIKCRGKMAGQNPKNPYPDGDMEHAVVILIFFTVNDFFHEWLRFRLHFKCNGSFVEL